MNRRAFLATSAAALAVPSSRRSNVVVLFADDMRFNTIRALGNHEIKTPHLDRLCASGVAFERAHIMGGDSGAVCIASRAMLLSGQTLFRAMKNVHGPKERASEFTLMGEHFRNSGYQTYGIGKWHNPPALFNRCFENGSAIFFGGMSDHLKVPIHDYDAEARYTPDRARIGGKFSTELFTDEAVRFLKGQDGKKPFFLYTAFTAPHDPRMAPPSYLEQYTPGTIKVPENFMAQHPFDNGELKVRDEMLAGFPRSPGEVCRHIAAYYAMITHLDSQIGRIVETLRETGREKDTVIVFAGDNGLALGQHGLMGKQSLYEHSVRVPLIFSGPGVPKNQRRPALNYLLDVFPTLCDLTGTKTPGNVEGMSLAPAIHSANGEGRQDLFLAYRHLMRGYSDGEWKLIVYHVNGTSRTQLFNLKEDPYEVNDLSEVVEAKEKIAELTGKLRAWMKKVDDPIAAAWAA